MRILAAVILSSLAMVQIARAQADADAGGRIYQTCAGCHGFAGDGNALVNAPRLAGLETWYLQRQMRNFAADIRGHADGDENGRRMAIMARAVRGERDLEDLLAYIGTLPATFTTDEGGGNPVDGDADNGRRLYATCAACHGADGEGNEALASPGLAGLDDWYLLEQLRLYADGLRGTHPEDTYGRQMRAMAGSFTDGQARRDIVAYIRSLGR